MLVRRALVGGSRLTRSRRVPNPYSHASKLEKVYGQYAKYFDQPEDSVTKYDDKWDKTKQIVDLEMGYYDDKRPRRSPDCYVAPTAVLAGNVEVWDNASVWYGVTIRGDKNLVRIGIFSNIQENSVIEESMHPIAPDHDGSVIIGHYVTVGHGCLLRGCTIESKTLVGMGSKLLEGSYMEEESQLGAFSVLEKNQRVPSRQLWAGVPARYVRDLTEIEVTANMDAAEVYYGLSVQHRDAQSFGGMLHVEAENKGLNFTHHRNLE